MCHDYKHGQIKQVNFSDCLFLKLCHTDLSQTYWEICNKHYILMINCLLGQFTTRAVLRYGVKNCLKWREHWFDPPYQTHAQQISTSVDGGLSGGSSVHRPGGSSVRRPGGSSVRRPGIGTNLCDKVSKLNNLKSSLVLFAHACSHDIFICCHI